MTRRPFRVERRKLPRGGPRAAMATPVAAGPVEPVQRQRVGQGGPLAAQIVGMIHGRMRWPVELYAERV